MSNNKLKFYIKPENQEKQVVAGFHFHFHFLFPQIKKLININTLFYVHLHASMLSKTFEQRHTATQICR